jgi:hypothetical protein
VRQINNKHSAWKVFENDLAPALIAGHSHIYSMFQALEHEKSLQKIFSVVIPKNFQEKQIHNEDYWDFVVASGKNKKMLISWNGNQHNIHFLLSNNQEFNSLGYFSGDEFPFIPISQVKELFRPTFLELKSVLEKFPKKSQLFLLGTPAPKDQSFLNERINSEEYFAEQFEKLKINNGNVSVSRNELRVFMWKITQEMTAEIALGMGAKFIPTPPQTYSENFILRREFYSNDLTHTNVDFGIETLKYISNSI